jgi:hypothetical protein
MGILMSNAAPVYINVLSHTFATWRRTNSNTPRGHTHIVREGSPVTLCGKKCNGWMENFGAQPEQASCLVCLRRFPLEKPHSRE